MTQFPGTGVAVVTPFDDSNNIDIPSLHKIIHHLIDGGISYLVVLGTTGETATLSQEEQEQVIEIFLEVNDGRLPIVLGIGGNNTKAIAQKAESWSAKFQPEGILSVSPYYNKPTQAGIYQHFASLAQATDVPIILYNVPGRTASNMEATTTLRLAHDFTNIVAIKEASGDLIQCARILAGKPDHFEVISGDDPLTLPIIGAGGIGVISVIANALPSAFSRMTQAALNNDWKIAQGIQADILHLMELNFVEGNPAGVKAMMSLLGLCGGDVRLPLVPASQDLKDRISKGLTLLNNKVSP